MKKIRLFRPGSIDDREYVARLNDAYADLTDQEVRKRKRMFMVKHTFQRHSI